MSKRNCPYCNSAAVVGLGAFFDTRHTAVELRCCDCGKLFVGEDRRNAAQSYHGTLDDLSMEDI
jgi:hypothetical protein